MSLYHKYRPETLEEMIGNESLIETLRAMLSKEDPPHSYLFTGPSGCGKTTLARIIKETLGCSDGDYYEIDSADFRGIDSIREIRRNINFKPSSGDCRVWLIDECHQLTKDAQTALLKALEDTPKHVYFILATTELKKLLPTIKTRCTSFEVKLLDDEQMEVLINWVSENEGLEVPVNVTQSVIKTAQGSARKALVALEKLIGLDEDAMLGAVQDIEEEEKQVIDLCRYLLSKKPNWKGAAELLKKINEEPESARRMMLGYFSSVLLKTDNSMAYNVLSCFADNFYDSGKAGLIAACYEAVNGR